MILAVKVVLETMCKVINTMPGAQKVFGKCLFLSLLLSSHRLLSVQNVVWDENKSVFLLIFA